MRDECEHGSLTRKCEICSEWKPRALEAEARVAELESSLHGRQVLPYCPRCCRIAPADIHTCTPTPEWQAMEAKLEAIPEGCTPADARVLREANHALAAENDGLRARIEELGSRIPAGVVQDHIKNILDASCTPDPLNPTEIAAINAGEIMGLLTAHSRDAHGTPGSITWTSL